MSMSRTATALALVMGIVLTCGGAGPAPGGDATPGFSSRLRIPEAAWFLGKETAVLSRDGKWVFSARLKSNKLSVSVFDAGSGVWVRDLPMGKTELHSVVSVALSDNGKVAAAAVSVGVDKAPLGEAYEIRVWDFPTGRERPALTGFKMGSMRIALSADGRWLSSSAGWLGGSKEDPFPAEVKLFDLNGGKAVFSLGKVDGQVHDATVSPDGKTFAWIAGKTLHVCDAPAMTERGAVPLPPRLDFGEIGISPDGGTMVTVGQHLAMIWDLPSLKPRRSVIIDHIGGGRPAFTQDGKTVAIPFYEKVIFFDAQTGQATGAIVAERPKYVPRSISLSGDGTILATMQGDGKTAGVHLFDATKLDPPPPLRDADAKALGSEGPLTTPGTADEGGGGNGKGNRKSASAGSPPTTRPNLFDPTGGSTPPTPAAKPAPPAAADPGALVGTWSGSEGAFRVTWKIAHNDQTWTITGTWTRGSAEIGSAHGENASFADGVLTFSRFFDKKPDSQFSTDAQITMELKDGKLAYVATAGKKVKRLVLRSAGST
jgi:hypothetical protein